MGGRTSQLKGKRFELSIANKLCLELNINIKDVAYIGDDLNDIKLLESVGFSAAPNNAPIYIKKKVDFVTISQGGKGAFREFIEEILGEETVLRLIEK